MKKPFKHFDLPTYHLTGTNYIPPRAYAADEIERRRAKPHGSLILEQQQRGLFIATRMIEQLEDETDLRMASDLLTPATINSSWYSFARDAQDIRMRRRLELMTLSDELSEELLPAEEIKHSVVSRLNDAAVLAAELHDDHINKRSTLRTRQELGKTLGSAATGLSSITLQNQGGTLSPFAITNAVRTNTLRSLSEARVIRPGESHQSLAQLVEPYSDLSVRIHRTTTPTISNLLRNAQKELYEEVA